MLNTTLPFGEFTPDLPDVTYTEAKNVVPHKDSYRQMKGLVTTSSALTAYCRGAAAMEDSNQAVEAYAGDETKLYRLGSGTWADKSSTTYSTATKAWWAFLKWGEAVIACNGPVGDAIQTKAFGPGTDFANLGGSPPKAKAIASVKSFIVLGDINDGTHYPNKIQWSGQNLETSWGTNPATQADSQLLAGDGGAVQAIMGGDVGTVICERSIWELQYQGPPTIFSVIETAPGLGTPSPRSVVQFGHTIYFLGNDGFYSYVPGKGASPIGDKKVDLWFDSRVEKTNMHRVCAAVDIPNGKIVWAYPTGSGDCDELLIYDYKTARWSYAEVDTEVIFAGRSEGYTIDNIDTLFSNSIDTAGMASLDDDQWKGGALALYGFDLTHASGSFGGTALTSRLETAELALEDAAMIFVNSMRPLVQGTGSTNTVYVGSRDSLTDSVVYGSAITANTIGEFNTRDVGRYMRFRCDTAGGFDHAVGMRVSAQAMGIR